MQLQIVLLLAISLLARNASAVPMRRISPYKSTAAKELHMHLHHWITNSQRILSQILIDYPTICAGAERRIMEAYAMVAENIFIRDQFTPYDVVLRHALLDNQNEIAHWAIRHGAKIELTDAWVRNMKNQQALRLAQIRPQSPVRKSLKHGSLGR